MGKKINLKKKKVLINSINTSHTIKNKAILISVIHTGYLCYYERVFLIYTDTNGAYVMIKTTLETSSSTYLFQSSAFYY